MKVILAETAGFCYGVERAVNLARETAKARGGAMLGAALVQVAFNLGNALGAYVGGLPIGHGLGYEYTALPGAAFVLLGMTAAMIYIRKYPRHEQR